MPDLHAPRDDDELTSWFLTEAVGFGGTSLDEAFVAAEQTVLPRDRMVAAWEGGRAVAVAGAYPFELTLPGGATVGAAGVADIAVLPGHRRRGHLAALMAHLHAQARDRGEPAAVLTASDGSIYRRFGYGIATTHLVWELDTTRARFLDPVGGADAAADLVVDHAVGAAPAAEVAGLWERTRRDRPGTLSRSEAWWRLVLGPFEHWKGGGKVHTLLLRGGDGEVRGALAYRLDLDVDRGIQQWRAEPLDVVADAPSVEARLWRELAGQDHVTRIAPRVRPVDDPLRFGLADPRQLRVTAAVDLLWLCPLDVPALLAARSYATSTTLVLAVDEPGDAGMAGTYRLEVGPAGADCTRVAATVDPDLRVPAAALGSTTLGGTTFTALARAGRLTEERPGALARADAAFATPLAPFNSTFF